MKKHHSLKARFFAGVMACLMFLTTLSTPVIAATDFKGVASGSNAENVIADITQHPNSDSQIPGIATSETSNKGENPADSTVGDSAINNDVSTGDSALNVPNVNENTAQSTVGGKDANSVENTVDSAPIACSCDKLCTKAEIKADCPVCKDAFKSCVAVKTVTTASLKERSDKLLEYWQQNLQVSGNEKAAEPLGEEAVLSFIENMEALILDVETLNEAEKAELEGYNSYFILKAVVVSYMNEAQPFGLTNNQALPTTAGATLATNTVYKVASNATITASSGVNGLNIASGATTVIYIPVGVTLTVTGGDAVTATMSSPNAGKGGGAGIYVPSNSTLIITGGGTLNATGGKGSSGGNGVRGDNPYYNNNLIYRGGSSGTAGQGGAGGGGAGAGIGGAGGAGGVGLSVTTRPGNDSLAVIPGSDSPGTDGYPGTNGGNGAASGTLYALGSVTITAKGGAAGTAGIRGDGGAELAYSDNANYGAGGGGGGGAGGYGSEAVGIGGGGAGGGSGGEGGYGAQGNGTNNNDPTYRSAGGNGGSGGAPNGQGGLKGSSRTGWGEDGNNATATGGGVSAPRDGNSPLVGGAGGKGGDKGSSGGNGTFYAANTATVNNNTGTGVENPPAVKYTITLDKGSATTGTATVEAVFGESMPTITPPTLVGYKFMGYYGSANGVGIKYYNADGTSAALWDTTVTTLYAYFVMLPSVSGTNIYGNCNALIITGTSDTATTIYIDSNRNGVLDNDEKSLASAGVVNAPADASDLSLWVIAGGTDSTALTGDTKITMQSGKVLKLAGGGNTAKTTGNTEITLMGGTVDAVYGGAFGSNASATVTGNSTVNISGGTVANDVNAQGYLSGATVSGTTKVNVSGNPKIGNKAEYGINLGQLTDGKVNITDALTSAAGDITLKNPTAITNGTVIATANKATTQALANKFTLLNSTVTFSGNDIVIGTAIPAVTVDNSNSVIYANGDPLLVISGETAGNTTIYVDTNKNGVVDTDELTLAGAMVFDAPADNKDLSGYTLYGGSLSDAVTGDTHITLTGGKLSAVFGGGKDLSATISGSKTVMVMGKPVVTNGIDLASLTDGKVLVCGALKGTTGAIVLKNPTANTAGLVVVEAINEANKPYVSAAKFELVGGELVQNKAASTVVISGPLDVAFSGTQITTSTEHFGTGKASYGKEWIGVMLPEEGYKLPTDFIMTIGGIPATKGTDYSYNSTTGEIKIDTVKGDVVITANGVPIVYSIIYNANGGKVNGNDTDTVQVSYGDTITFPTSTRSSGSSWSFLGWAYKSDAVTADFAKNTTTKRPLSNIDTAQVTLYAVWQSGDSLPTSLQNGSFEVPYNTGSFSQMYNYSNAPQIKWLTTAADKMIELGNPSKGLNASYSAYGTRTASEGEQFAELNANSVAALYQKVATDPGSTLYWGLDHRARSKTSSETMEVWIGSEAQVNEAINAYKADGNRVSTKTMAVFAKHPTLQRTQNITHDWLNWYPVDGQYTVPTSQTTTMFAFVSISNPASNSCGNLLDNVFFSTIKPKERTEITIRAGQGGTVRVSDADGFTIATPSTQYKKSLELGQMLQATVIANSGYSFNGGYVDGKYYTKADLLSTFDSLRLTMNKATPKEITILFAKDSTLMFNAEGGTYVDAEKTLVAEVGNAANSYTIGKPFREGYAFTGWLVVGTGKTLTEGDSVKYVTDAEDGTTTLDCSSKRISVPTEGGMILLAQWREAHIDLTTTTLTLSPNGGRYGEVINYGGIDTFIEWQTLYELDASYSGDNALTLKAPIREGYIFAGWKDTTGAYPAALAENDRIEYTIESDTAMLTVGGNVKTAAPATLALTAQWEKLPEEPVFTTQPADKTITYGYAAGEMLSATATVSVGDTLSYQWYSNTTDSNKNGTLISGATAATYSIPTNLQTGDYYYYCVATASSSGRTISVESSTATVTVEKAALSAAYVGEGVAYGASPSFTVDVTGFVNGETALTAHGYTSPVITGTIPTEVGIYSFTPSGGTAKNYSFTYFSGDLVILPASIATGDIKVNGYTGIYDATPHAITVETKNTAESASITYSSTAAGPYSAINPQYTDSGSYTVYFKVSKPNYADVIGSAEVLIRKKALNLSTVSVDDKVYDANRTTTGGNITLSGMLTGETVAASGTITFVTPDVGQNKAVNIDGITLGGINAKNYTIASSTASNVATTAKITPKPVELVWSNTDNKTYDKQPANVMASVKASDLIGGDVCNVIVSDGDKINAGPHTATAALTNANYTIKNSANTTQYTIAKANLTATYEGETVIYKDNAPTLAVKVTGFVNGDSENSADGYTAPTVTFPSVAADHVGEHNLTPSNGAAANYDFIYISGTLNIMSREFDLVRVRDYIGDYDAQPHTVDFINTDSAATNNTVIKYYNDDTYTTGETTVAPMRTNAGTTTVYYSVSAPGFTTVNGSATITINKKKVNPTLDSVSDKAYDGKADAVGTIKLVGVIAADVNDVAASGAMLFTDKNVGENKSVTVTGIALSGDKAGNYELTDTTLNTATTAQITAKPITIVWSGNTGLTYSGTAKNVTATIPTAEVVSGDTVNIIVTGGNEVLVGNGYAASASIDNGNYSLVNATNTYDIGKATLTAKYADESIVFGNLPKLAITITGFVNGETVLTASGYQAPTISTSPIPTNAGTHNISVTGGGADNYSFTHTVGELIITNASMTSEVSSAPYSGTYDGAAHGIKVIFPSWATIKYYSDENCTIELSGGAEKITSVADSPKTVYYKVTAPSYDDVIGSNTITITPKTLTISLDAVDSKTYDGKIDTTGVVLKASGMLDNEEVTASGTVSFVSKDVGKNKSVNILGITLSGLHKDNYTLSSASLTNVQSNAEITQKQVSLAWSGYDNLVYDAKEKNVVAKANEIIKGDICAVTVTGGRQTLPGKYTATATNLSNPNYKLPTVVTKDYTIDNATLDIVAKPYVGLFDGMLHIGVTLQDTLPTDRISYSTDGGKTWKTDEVMVGTVGDTDIQVRVERQYHNTVTKTVTAKVTQAPVIKLNKPIFDTTDVKRIIVGGEVKEGSYPINSQSFEIRKIGTNTWTPLNAGTTTGNTTNYNQQLENLEIDSEYELRLTATDTQGNTTVDTLKFRTQPKTPPTGAIEGSVSGLGKITVTIEMGNTVIASLGGLSDGDKFKFENLPDGEYNLVATDDSYKITKMVTVKDGKTTILGVVTIGVKQSVVKVEDGAPPVAADGLNELFNTDIFTKDSEAPSAVIGGGTVEMRLTAAQPTKAEEISEIKGKIKKDNKNEALMLDLTVDMIITPYEQVSTIKNIKNTGELIQIAIPLPEEVQGKSGYAMYRYHDGVVDNLVLLTQGQSPIVESFRIDGKYAYIYARKFSTYAIAFDKSSGGVEDSHEYFYITAKAGSGGSFSTSERVKVRAGESAGFTITPDKGYEIADVMVDGKSVGVVGEYVFTNVLSNRTISASFKKATKPVSPVNPAPDSGSGGGLEEKEEEAEKPEQNPSDLNKVKDELKHDLEQKKNDAINKLPDTLTNEERQKAIDEINRIYDEAVNAIDNAKSATEASELYNKAVRDFDAVLQSVGVATGPESVGGKKRPFILLSALLALLSVIMTVYMLIRRKKDEKASANESDEEKTKKKRIIFAAVCSIGAVVTFLLTTGWTTMAFANIWTLLVAAFTVAVGYLLLKASNDEKENAKAK